jgi:acyl-CoA thioesterase-2
MDTSLHGLVELLDLERIEQNIYRGASNDIVGNGRVFGGQVLAQALVAAQRTVEEERVCHSLHGYFILPGDTRAPIVYFVDRLRDGRSFTTRQVTAIQKGEAIFNLSASFQVREAGVEHQSEMPDVPGPEGLPNERTLMQPLVDRIPEPHRTVLTRERPIEFRPVEPVDFLRPEPRAPRKYVWFRANGTLGDELLQHQAVLAYASDYGLLGTALLPHALTFQMPRLQAATLDHSLWFHHPFRADEWLLYATDSPSASGARGFTRGSIFRRDGTLVASATQEGLLRLHEG